MDRLANPAKSSRLPGGYHRRVLGRGSKGFLLLAEKDGQKFAVKVVQLRTLVKDRDLRRFLRETSVLRQLEQPAEP